MKQLIQNLEALHAELIETLDADDVERLAVLVERRAIAVADLTAAHESASPAARQAASPALARLAELDRALQVRFQAARDQLGATISNARQGASQVAAPASSGVLDRRA